MFELIEMQFGMLSLVDPGDHVLDGVQMTPQEGEHLGCLADGKAW